MVFEKSAIAIRVFVGQISTKGMGVFPTPHNGVAGIGDHPWCVEVISMDVVNLNCAGGSGFLDNSNRDIT